MENSRTKRKLRRLAIFCVALFSLTAWSNARTTTPSLTIANNSSKAIVNVYLSHVNADDWGANQLGNTTIAPGQSFTVGNIACDQQQLKVIAEDSNGCFLETIVNCGEDSTWTITNQTPTDCGY